jgi:hypothetical protein
MENNRILELAIQELERRRAALSTEIETLRSEMKGTDVRSRMKGLKSESARKAQSERMKKYWAAKSKAVKKAPPGKAKARAKTAAEKKALSLKMKAVWRKRKAEAAKKK